MSGTLSKSANMARPLRIEYPGAFYHVFSRGDQKQPIFFIDEDRSFFLKCLRKACEKYGAVIHAYCLMPNHFHLFLETPDGNLSRMMHFMITNYTVHINRKHKRHGHVFQGRYRSVLVDGMTYAKELSRYIHLNPVRSGIVDSPERFPWSSFGYYRGVARPDKWLVTKLVLDLFGGEITGSRTAYEHYVNEAIGKEAPRSIADSARKGILGSEEFIERIKREYLKEEIKIPDREKPQLRRLRDKPDLSHIRSLSERTLGPGNRWIVPIAILIGHHRTAAKLGDIGDFFSLSVSGASNACARARDAISKNAALARAVEEIESELEK